MVHICKINISNKLNEILSSQLPLLQNTTFVKSTQHCLTETQQWIESFVIKHNLCPFAKQPFTKGLIDYRVSDHADGELLLTEFLSYIQFLNTVDSNEISNGFYILNLESLDFIAYLDLIGIAEAIIEDADLQDTFQLVSFHPEYQFSGTEMDDPSNFANRSPHPMIHILRVDEVEDAIADGEDVGVILQRNTETLNKLFG